MPTKRIHKTALWLPVIRDATDYELLPDEWKAVAWQDFNLLRASTLERFEAVAEKASEQLGVEVVVLAVKTTPQFMLRLLKNRDYTIASLNLMARLIALSPGFDPTIELGI